MVQHVSIRPKGLVVLWNSISINSFNPTTGVSSVPSKLLKSWLRISHLHVI